MARAKRKARRRDSIRAMHIDATPERLAKGDPYDFVNPGKIDSSEQPIGLVRRFQSAHLDRLHKRGSLSWVQWYAGDWYRQTHARARFSAPAIAAYGERTAAPENPANFGYGLPRQEAAVRARDELRKARQQFPAHMVGFMDRLLIHDAMPRYGGRAAMRNLAEIRNALDTLACYLRIG